MKSHIQNLMRIFFNRNFSENSRSVFGNWMTSKKNARLKEEVMWDIWKDLSGDVTEQTRDDWENVYSRMSFRTPYRFYRFRKYAAVLVLLILSAAAVLYFQSERNSYDNNDLMDFFVAYGESRRIILEDGSEVSVNAGSLLLYPKEFGKTKRIVFLRGEAVFTVAKNSKPFEVRTTNLQVQVLGTEFTVQAFPEDKFSRVTLENGSVKVNLKPDNEEKLLLPGQQLIYSQIDGSISIHDVDMTLYAMEKQGYLIFENASLKDIFKTLERRYNMVINYNLPNWDTNNCNVKFAPNETIEEIFLVLKQLTGLKYKIDGNTILIN